MGNPTPDREVTEALWRKRVADAKTGLYFARSYVKEVQQDLQSGAVPAPDGDFALARALRAERLALAEYERVLRVFRAGHAQWRFTPGVYHGSPVPVAASIHVKIKERCKFIQRRTGADGIAHFPEAGSLKDIDIFSLPSLTR